MNRSRSPSEFHTRKPSSLYKDHLLLGGSPQPERKSSKAGT